MLPLSTAWTCEKGFPLEAGIPKLWDTIVSGTSGVSIDPICSFLPHDGQNGPVSSTGYCPSAFLVTDRSERPEYGSGQRSGAIGLHFRDSGACLRHNTVD